MEKIGCEAICKNHSARSERDHYRICPTKLSKTELEDVYFAVLENNMQLKKTINIQQDKIKVLSTKVQRMTSAQNVQRADENKNCCVATKAVVKQQKEMIAELQRANERMADRVRKLNMRLCSAKQFCKSATPRGLRCSIATSPYLIKHSPCSYKQNSHSTLKLAVSCQNLSRETLITKCVQTDPFDLPKVEDENKVCDNNKCKTVLEEYEEKIVNLQEKFLKIQEEYEIELQVTRAKKLSLEHELQQTENRNALLISNLRTAEGLQCELNMQLSIEKRRVLELETRLRTATMSNNVTKNIEHTLTSIQESNRTSEPSLTCACCSPIYKLDSTSQTTESALSTKDLTNVDKLSKTIDDSGYDTNKSQLFMDDQSLNKIIDELTQRIMVLQTQVDALTISPPEADEKHTNIEEDDINTQTVLHHSTPKENKSGENNFNINPNQQAYLTDDESVDSEINNEVNEDNIITSPKSSRESSKSDNWKKTKTKLHLITYKNNKQAKETTVEDDKEDQIKINDKDNNKSVDENEVKNSVSKKDKINSPKEQSSSTENKTYNISNKSNPVIDEKEKCNKKDQETKGHGSPKKVKDYYEGDDPKKVNNNKKRKAKIERKSVTKTHRNANTKQEMKVEKHKTKGDDVSSSEEATYTLERDSSALCADTDSEISSMTDLTHDTEIKSGINYLSPGERKYPLAHSDSHTTLSTNYSLSEGEIHLNTVRRRSLDDKPRTSSHIMTSTPKMEETLEAVSEELARCRRLLFSQKSYENASSVLM